MTEDYNKREMSENIESILDSTGTNIKKAPTALCKKNVGGECVNRK